MVTLISPTSLSNGKFLGRAISIMVTFTMCENLLQDWNTVMTRHDKARPGEARRGQTRRRPDKKVSPGFEKYCTPETLQKYERNVISVFMCIWICANIQLHIHLTYILQMIVKIRQSMIAEGVHFRTPYATNENRSNIRHNLHIRYRKTLHQYKYLLYATINIPYTVLIHCCCLETVKYVLS